MFLGTKIFRIFQYFLPASLAIALATIVLPHPGGPCNNKPIEDEELKNTR